MYVPIYEVLFIDLYIGDIKPESGSAGKEGSKDRDKGGKETLKKEYVEILLNAGVFRPLPPRAGKPNSFCSSGTLIECKCFFYFFMTCTIRSSHIIGW